MKSKHIHKIAIIELCMSPDLGGLELYMAKASLALQKNFNVISVINENAKLNEYLDETVKIKKTFNIFMFSSAKKLAKLIDDKEVKLLHIHWTKDIPFVVLAKVLSNSKPKIVQSRHMSMTRYKDDFYHNFLYKNIDMILAVTKQVQEQIIKYIPSDVRPKLEVLYPGADKQKNISDKEVEELQEKLGMKNNSFKIGMVGRINEDKGQHLLIKAVELLNLRGHEVDAYFVGSAMSESYLEKLKEEVKEKNLQNSIHFVGFLKSPSSFYAACDTIVMASKRETFGLVLVEAMLMKKSVVAPNSGGVLEIIDDRKNGLLFESQNFESLADSLELLINDKELVKNIATKAKEKAIKMFDNEIQFKELSKIFQKELEC